MKFFSSFFDKTDKSISKMRSVVDEITAYETSLKKMSATELKAQTELFRKRLNNGETTDDILAEAFATVREAARRTLKQRAYDEQIIGGIVLHKGDIAEMKTGEGKTLTSTMPIYLNSISGKGVHVITVNDYLAQRDANWMGIIFDALGLSTACIIHAKSHLYHPKVIDANEVDIEYKNLVEVSRREAYAADITYGTNNEFGFDYLRDNMAQDIDSRVQRKLHYAIVDEVDSILIDESRTPLIISAPDTESTKLYNRFAQIVPRLKRTTHYVVDEKLKAVTLTDAGVDAVEEQIGEGNIYEPGKIHYVHHLEQAIKAHVIFQRDRDYVVKDGQIIIVDDFTGRLMEGRRYSEGLHQSIEAKEHVEVQKESKTLATITFQNYFRLYDKLAGMTGTALTSAEEFNNVYSLEVIPIPTHKNLVRDDRPDVVYKTESAKFNAIADVVVESHKKGQPVLVGTVAIEKSEEMSRILKKRNIPHNVLNAKQHEHEASIITAAGQKGTVTIATNMAGRGTDIKLGDEVDQLGGLFIIGSERHEARRIDNQLRGRSGRQGDPGVSQFFVSLEDELMRRFGGEKLKSMMNKLGLPDDEPIQNRMIAKAIENAQTKIEGFNFDLRKHVLEYDDVVSKQRETIYKKREDILTASTLSREIETLVSEYIENIVETHTAGEEFHWETKEIIKEISAQVPNHDISQKLQKITEDESQELEDKRKDIILHIKNIIMKEIASKEQSLGNEMFQKIGRAILLQTIDRNWVLHLDALDYLRQGIGLRGYGQRDPLIEYKREAFSFFRTMLATVRENVTETLLKFDAPTVETTPKRNNLTEAQFTGATDINSFESLEKNRQTNTQNNSNAPKKQETIIKEKTPGRNDPCSCGSGKKYKKCCGK